MTSATFSRIFNAINTPHSALVDRHLPMINSVTNSLGSYLSNVNQISKKRSLMNWYKAIPELNALVNKVARDIVYRYHFEPINPRDSGRNKIEKANRFAQQICLRKVMLSQVIDQLVTGDGFGWMGKVTDADVKIKLKQISKQYKYNIETKERQKIIDEIYNEIKAVEGFADSSKVDEDLLRPRRYRYIPSTTVEIIHNDFDILHYNHVVGIKTVKFQPKEVVHFTFMDVDGKVNGFTPVESVLVQLELLRQMWQNMLSIHKNGGSPDMLLAVENIQPNSPAYKRIEQQLERYKVVENKHGTLLFTGKVNVHELNQIDKMQFMDSGLYITGLIAMQWQVPRSSIPYIVGGTNTKDDTGGNSEKGYWRNIEINQEIYAETMNSQLWIPNFGVKIVFDNTFLQQDVQLQTTEQLKLNNILSTDQILLQSGKQLNLEKRMRLLGLTPEDLEEGEKEELPGATGMNNQLSNSQVEDSDDKKNVKAKKKKEQIQSTESRGMPSTGTGKEWDTNTELEFKQTIGSSEEEVDMNTFIKLYNEDKKNNVKAPRIFMRQNEDQTTFKYMSVDFVYKTRISIEDIDSKKIILMNIGGNIYKL